MADAAEPEAVPQIRRLRNESIPGVSDVFRVTIGDRSMKVTYAISEEACAKWTNLANAVHKAANGSGVDHVVGYSIFRAAAKPIPDIDRPVAMVALCSGENVLMIPKSTPFSPAVSGFVKQKKVLLFCMGFEKLKAKVVKDLGLQGAKDLKKLVVGAGGDYAGRAQVVEDLCPLALNLAVARKPANLLEAWPTTPDEEMAVSYAGMDAYLTACIAMKYWPVR